MAHGLSVTNLANKWLDMLRGVAFTAPASVWVKLHTGDPGANGTANASAVTTRGQITWNAANVGAITLASGPSFSMTTTETISFVSFWDASSAGNFLFSRPLASNRSVTNGDTLAYTNAATQSLSPQAA